MTLPELRTPRLRLRPWRDADLPPFADLNADPQVMTFFPAPLTRAESDAAAARIRAHFTEHGFGLWAVEWPGCQDFAGFVGLAVADFPASFTPCVEVGWRLARSAQGRGLATEGARAALAFGFRELGLDEIVSFTAVGNAPSRRVMEKLGMRRDPGEDFEHPRVPAGHALRRHVLYRLPRAAWPAAPERGPATRIA